MATKKTKVVVKGGFTLVGEDGEGQFKLDVPEGARLTFGPDVPFERRGPGVYDRPFAGNARAYALRVYIGDELIACLAGVHWFRKETIPMSRLIHVETGRKVWESSKDGYKVEEAVKRDGDWKQLT